MHQLHSDYPTESKALIRAIIDQEGFSKDCAFSKVAIGILQQEEVSEKSIQLVIEGLKGLRERNQLVDGVSFSIHSPKWRK